MSDRWVAILVWVAVLGAGMVLGLVLDSPPQDPQRGRPGPACTPEYPCP